MIVCGSFCKKLLDDGGDHAAVSKSGKIRGTWEHIEKPIYDNNGGHAMFFTDFDGTRRACFYAPEHAPFERATLKTVVEEDGVLRLV